MAMKPKFARIAQGYENKVVFLKVFIDKGGVPEIKKRANVVAVPTFQMWQVRSRTPEPVTQTRNTKSKTFQAHR
jgi:thiol-disulfide isomerase/thioredoxin